MYVSVVRTYLLLAITLIIFYGGVVLKFPPCIHTSHHIAVIFYKSSIISFGYNGERHAEVDAIRKLSPNRGKIKQIDILIIKVIQVNDNTIITAMSAPCFGCIKAMYNIDKIGYSIRRIYFSKGNNNEIIITTLDAERLNPSYNRSWRQK